MNNQSMLLYPAQTREYKDFGFMRAHLSFKPHLPAERQSFGSLITIDDAILKPGATGFGLHQHKDVEVVTFVIQGEVRHIDPNEERHTGTLKAKGVQIITAGNGITHNEENHSADEELHVLQIWFKPKQQGLNPNYAKKSLNRSDYTNQLLCILSPDGLDESLVMQQDAFVYYHLATSANSLAYTAKSENRRIFIYLIAGNILINTEKLTKGDGCGLIGYRNIELDVLPDTEFLLLDIEAICIGLWDIIKGH
jgi:quercetin 2,3-dioxygenase